MAASLFWLLPSYHNYQESEILNVTWYYHIFIYGCGICATGVPCESGIPVKQGTEKQVRA